MNLLETIEIHAGGPGSGCQGPNCGRKHSQAEMVKRGWAHSQTDRPGDQSKRYWARHAQLTRKANAMLETLNKESGYQGLDRLKHRLWPQYNELHNQLAEHESYKGKMYHDEEYLKGRQELRNMREAKERD